MNFYRILSNPAATDFWFPDEPLSETGDQIDAREFTQGRAYNGATPCCVPLAKEGIPSCFIFAAFDMPIISTTVGEVLSSICPTEIERFPVKIGSHAEGFEILNITSSVSCIDEPRSTIIKWTQQDSRPDKVGMYRMVTTLAIDGDKVLGKHLFRTAGWEIALIASDVVRRAIAEASRGGIVFVPVNDVYS